MNLSLAADIGTLESIYRLLLYVRPHKQDKTNIQGTILLQSSYNCC